MGKSRSPFGCVQEIRRGKYRLRWMEDTPQGRKRKSEVIYGTRREAYDRMAELHVQSSNAPEHKTVGKAWEEWVLPEIEDLLERGDISRATYERKLSRWNRWVSPTWSKTPCSQVAPLAVQEWLLTMTGPLALQSKGVLSEIMAKAVLFGFAKSNPCDLKYRMPREVAAHDKGVYSLEELGAVSRAVAGTPVEGPFLLMAFGSCRPGEALGVKVGEVALSRVEGVDLASAPIVRQITARGLSDSLKNAQSRRTAFVPGPLGLALARAAQRAGRTGPWLFGDGLGGPGTQSQFKKAWSTALGRACLDPHPPRNLRASWETNAHWTLGLDPTVIEPLMGHAGKTVTARHYDRPSDEMLARAVALAYKAHPFAESWDWIGLED